MSVLVDDSDPTTALFLSEAAASRAAALVLGDYSDRVSRAVPKLRKSRGEAKGYALIIHFKDKRSPSPLTNSDFERLVERFAA